MPLTAEGKKQWIEALRSGKYGQTKKTLEDDDGFCCLGVKMACMGAPPIEYFTETVVVDEDEERSELVDEALATTVLPPEFQTGLTADECTVLANLNDGTPIGEGSVVLKLAMKWDVPNRLKPMNFVEISKVIEDNIEVIDE